MNDTVCWHIIYPRACVLVDVLESMISIAKDAMLQRRELMPVLMDSNDVNLPIFGRARLRYASFPFSDELGHDVDRRAACDS